MKPIVLGVFAAAASAASLVCGSSEAKSWVFLEDTCATSISAGYGYPVATGCTRDSTGNHPILYLTSYTVLPPPNSAAASNTWQTYGGWYSIGGVWVSGASYGGTGELLVERGDGSIWYEYAQGGSINSVATLQAPAGTAKSVTIAPSLAWPYAAITTDTWSGPNGYDFAYFNFATNGFGSHPFPGAGAFFTVSEDGTQWAVGETGGVYHFEGGSWVQKRGPTLRNHLPTVFRADLGTVAGDAYGHAYAVTSGGDLEMWNGSSWTTMSPTFVARQVSVGTDGSLWALDESNVVWVYQ